MEITWDQAQTFLAVAEHRSFSGAARALRLGQPTVSRRIATLEHAVGCPLFRRGKAGAELTADGARMVPAAEQMARWATELNRLAAGTEEAPAGIVRIAAPPGLAVEYLAPLATMAQARLPDIRLEVLSSLDFVDLSRGVADLALRTRPTVEPELVTLQSISWEIGVFAAPSYAARVPAKPKLADLDWVTWAYPVEHLSPRPFLEREIPDFAPSFASDDYLVLKAAVAAGMGAMILERVQPPAASAPSLVEIDVGLQLPTAEMHLVCARSMRYVPRVRAVADLILEQVRAVDLGERRVGDART